LYYRQRAFELATPKLFSVKEFKDYTKRYKKSSAKKKGKPSYAPTLIGVEISKQIKGTKALASRVFTGLEVRPQVKIPTIRRSKPMRKKRK